MTPSRTTTDAPAATALHELARQFDHQGYALKRSSHGGALLATRDGDVRHLDGIAEAKRFLQNIGETDRD
jgi:hypothetical protein